MVRNPDDRMVSWYFHHRQPGTPTTEGLHEWVRVGARTHWDEPASHYYARVSVWKQLSWLTWQGEVVIQPARIYRLEDLHASFPRRNASVHETDCRLYFEDDDVRRIAASLCAAGLVRFDYRF